MKLLNVKEVTKQYPKFLLDKVSFSLDEGYIMGFIGSNGAGKTTTLKAIMNLIMHDGSVEIFGQNFIDNEHEIKQKMGFMLGDTEFYKKRKIKTITEVVKRFYSNWDEPVYKELLNRFALDPEKMIDELSKGMKIKYNLTLALSHHAKLIILDEPTSGLDPVARDGLLELFQELVEDGLTSVLFSTHITSDLEKCADYITFINEGKIVESTSMVDLMESYRLVNGSAKELNEVKRNLIAHKTNSFGFTGLMKTEFVSKYANLNSVEPSLDDIMIYYAKAGR